MSIGRVVTGHPYEGKSTIASDEMIAGFEAPMASGNVFHVLWGADSPQTYPDDGSPSGHRTWYPPPSGFRFLVWTMPSDSMTVIVDHAEEALAQTERLMPGLLGHMEMEADSSGFHASNTTDMGYVLSGRIILQQDDGTEVELRAGDTVVQNGTRHTWRNPGPDPCTLVMFSVGAHRSA